MSAKESPHPNRKNEGALETSPLSEVLERLDRVDVTGIFAEDPLAYATGYVTACLGMAPDPRIEPIPIPDYVQGYELGRAVVEGSTARPHWDVEARMRWSGIWLN